jgi:alcohol dehydrogenase
MQEINLQIPTRAVFGAGALESLGRVARCLDFHRALVVSDRGIVAAGHFARAVALLRGAGVDSVGFHGFTENPDTRAVEAGRAFAASHQVDSIVALGGGSSLDCAKGINFVLTNGGQMQDYRGYGKAALPMLPMIGIPTTAGTGSEAQSYALISDAETHAKMACGDPKAAFRFAILDPQLAATQPARVRAVTGYDAISHAVESWVTTKRNATSDDYAMRAWRLLEPNFERVLATPDDAEANGAMMQGAFYAGAAIENSMLGATHACANPLTARYGTVHGVAIALLLAHVVRWNASLCAERYVELVQTASQHDTPLHPCGSEALAQRLETLAVAGSLHTRLRDANVPREDLPLLAKAAANEWTGQFNPRPFDAAGALEVYECAY